VTQTRSVHTRLALVATVLSLLAGVAHADVAGTGTFEISAGAGVPATIGGTILFATGTRTVLGEDVDLAADVGDMAFSGTMQVDAATLGAAFEFTAGPASQLVFHASGVAACAVAGCLEGNATFGGTLDLITDPMNVLPDATYTFDGTVYVGVLVLSGGFGLNAFAALPTAAGADRSVASGPTTFFDSAQGITRSFEATVRFPNVTAGGTTTFVAFSALPGDLPAGYTLVPELSTFVDVVTSGVAFTGEPQVCIADGDGDADGIVDGAGFPVTELRVLHAAAAGQAFADVTTASPSAGFVCGTGASLSPFVLARTTTPPDTGCGDPIACIDAALAAPLCGAETINARLQALIEKKLGVARTAVTKAASAKTKKRERLLQKAGKQLDKIGLRADAFVEKRKEPISAACRDGIRAALDRIGAALDAL
jgi:hypothetical protein